MNEKPLWQQYGFATEAEFFKRYPHADKTKRGVRVIEKDTGKKGKKQSRVMTKQEQTKINRINEITGFGQ